jgi:predicted O-methyltransferase YrrM
MYQAALMYCLNRVRGMLRSRQSYPTTLAPSFSCKQTVDFIKTTKCRNIAEVGVYRGETSVELARFLNNEGTLHLFDFHDAVERVHAELLAKGFRNVMAFGSSYKIMDSYNWQFANLIEKHEEPIYDYVFLDGAHVWAVDALAVFLIDKLLKVGGYMDLDDYDWSLADSPSLNPVSFPMTKKRYTDEQINAKQIKMVIDLLIKRDRRYQEVVPNKIYRKIG